MPFRLLVLLLLLGLVACGDEANHGVRESGGTTVDYDATRPPEQLEADDPLADLARPAEPKPGPEVGLDDYLADVVTRLVVEGGAAVADLEVIKGILGQLETEGLLSRGRPEGVIRDLVARMKEDIEILRPPDLNDKPLDDYRRRMLRQLGRAYANDVRRALSPKGAGGQHEGSLRAVPAIPTDRLRPGHEALSFKRIGGFDFDRKKKVLPAEILALDGRKVALAGYLMPVADYEDIHEFLLVESIWTCCFGEAPAVNRVVIVTIPADRPGIPLYQDAILVHGVLDVGVEEDEGWVTSVYRMSADSVETLPAR